MMMMMMSAKFIAWDDDEMVGCEMPPKPKTLVVCHQNNPLN
jgi:hypothetical protein